MNFSSTLAAPFQRGRFFVAVLLASFVLAPLASPAHAETFARTVSVDANTLHVTRNQERSCFFSCDYDEPYVAVIGYRATLGVAGSATTQYLGHLRELSSSARAGATLTIRDNMGKFTATGVVRRSLTDLQRGLRPEIVGTVTLVMESDATPWSSMDSMMNRAAVELRRQINSVIGSFSVTSLPPANIGPRFANVISSVRRAALGSPLQMVGTFLASFADPDDVIGTAVTGFVAVDDSAAALINPVIAAYLPPSVGTFGTLTNRAFNMNFSARGATYDVTWLLSI